MADFTGSTSTTVTRKPEVTCDTDERRPHTSSDYLFTSAPSQHYQPSVRTVPDSFAPPAFTVANIDADNWLAHFRRYAEYRQLSDRDSASIFPLFLKDSAIGWYDTLAADLKNDYEQLVTNFKSYFGKSALDYVSLTRQSSLGYNVRTRRPETTSLTCRSWRSVFHICKTRYYTG